MADILELVDLDELRHQVREKYREVAGDPGAFNMSTISIPAVPTRCGWATHRIL